jgi:hypothetical protein
MRRLPTFVLLASSVSLVALGCSDDGPTPSPVPNAGNGVNDVVKACEQVAGWTRPFGLECSNCRSNVRAAPCECGADETAAKCHEQSATKDGETDCTAEVAECAGRCGSDCACVGQCYVGHDACRRVASAVDGCVATVCESRCR